MLINLVSFIDDDKKSVWINPIYVESVTDRYPPSDNPRAKGCVITLVSGSKIILSEVAGTVIDQLLESTT